MFSGKLLEILYFSLLEVRKVLCNLIIHDDSNTVCYVEFAAFPSKNNQVRKAVSQKRIFYLNSHCAINNMQIKANWKFFWKLEFSEEDTSFTSSVTTICS